MPPDIKTPDEFRARCRVHLHFLLSEFGFEEMPLSDHSLRDLGGEPFRTVFVKPPIYYVLRGTNYGRAAAAAVGRQSAESPTPELFSIHAVTEAATAFGMLSVDVIPRAPTGPGQEIWIAYLANVVRHLTPGLISDSEHLWTELHRLRAQNWERWLDENYTANRDSVRHWMDTPVVGRIVTDWLRKRGYET